MCRASYLGLELSLSVRLVQSELHFFVFRQQANEMHQKKRLEEKEPVSPRMTEVHL